MPPTPARSTAPSGTRARTPPRALSRRAALGLAATTPLALVLSACSGTEVRDRLDSGVDRLRAPRSTPPAPANPDQQLVDQASSAIAGMRAALLPHRAAGAVVTGLIALHTAHLEALGRPHATAAASAGSAAGSGTAITQLAPREQALAASLATKAGVAQDGDLARLLASMSAAIAQRVAGGLR